MKRLLGILLVLLLMLQYRLWFGNNSLPQYFQLQGQIEAQRASNQQLEARNQVLHNEIKDLKEGSQAIEERARQELGMVKDGETFYRVINRPARQ
ncbi:cell division protein FtsB [Paraferrimonas sedimenticola]|uniref:Cell division protein FtsB n=1 Tax=Paraferrimonas sedimenticola TaxID=375674 RepID=A0AA37W1J7_9GAMM|nr:cell division protein FtsB [Paraferrimonas sedimenticola]GLP96868.1 cell division protein FtsB [Paraferrimonas sedimenticola]